MMSTSLSLIWCRRLSTSPACFYGGYGATWKKLKRRQNPEIVRDLPTMEFVKDGGIKKTRMAYVCGFGATGALGLPKYYQPGKKHIDDLKAKDTTLTTFKRLHVEMDSIKDVACGYGFTLMAGDLRNSSQTALGFGLNSHSQIGYQSARPGFPLEIVINPMPINLPTKSAIRAVSAGRSHSLFLNQEGQVLTIGNNSFGQCGRPVVEKEEYFGSKRSHIIEGLPTDIDQIICGQDHSMFLTKTGELYACGWGADGQTGLGHFNSQPLPARVNGDLEAVHVIKVSASADTVLALDKDGNVFGWGNSEYAQFKALTGDESEQLSTPKHLNMINVPGKIIDVAAGGTMCAILNDKGQVFVWGYGLLGKGPEVDHLERPTLLPESLFGMSVYNPNTKVVKIFAGLSQFAAITNKGDLYTWGRNRGCSLGLDHSMPQYFPMQVNVSLAAVTKVSLGIDHTCVIAEKVC